MTDCRLHDEILIRRSQQGDTKAIDELLIKYQRIALMYALKMTKDMDDAADVVSEGFIRVHRAIARFQVNSAFSTWLFKILRNCFLDVLGRSPIHYLKAVRLNAVHRELGSPHSPYATVQDAAMAWGFWHMGQFGRDYQRLFGERPSATLANRERLSAAW